MTSLTVVDLLRAGDFDAAVARMQELCRVMDPEVPIDAEATWAQFVEARDRLRAVVPPAPFRITVELVRA